MFKEYKQNLGTLAPNEKVSIVFTYEGDMNIKQIWATCDCTQVQWDKENNSVKAVYTTKPVPHHLKMNGKTNYHSTKTIKVLTDTKEITLTFDALIQE